MTWKTKSRSDQPVRLGLTRRQAEAYRELLAGRDRNGLLPSPEALARRLGVTPSSARRLLANLERRGWLIRDPQMPRSYALAPGAKPSRRAGEAREGAAP